MFLGKNPKVVKKKSVKMEEVEGLNEVRSQKVEEELIKAERARIIELSEQLRGEENKIEQTKKALASYDPLIEEQMLNEELKSSKEEWADLCKKIANCQLVESTTAREEYYLWQRKQRTDTYDRCTAEMYLRIEAQKDALLEEIASMKHEINQREEESKGKVEYSPEEYREEITKQEELKLELQNITATVQIKLENTEILTAQLKDGAETILESLQRYFEMEQMALSRELKATKFNQKHKEIGPLSNEEKIFKLEHFINDYVSMMKFISLNCPEHVKSFVEDLLEPLPWEHFEWKEFTEPLNKNNIYEEYQKKEIKCLELESEIKMIEEETKEIDLNIESLTKKYKDVTTAIAKSKKILKK